MTLEEKSDTENGVMPAELVHVLESNNLVVESMLNTRHAAGNVMGQNTPARSVEAAEAAQETWIEEEKKIPELTIHETSPFLEGGAEKVLQGQWERFWQLRFTKSNGKVFEAMAQNVALLRNGTLLHNLHYDETALLKILQSGILSGELGYGDKEMRSEDSETHYCADFFVNQGDKSVQEYIEYAHSQEKIGTSGKLTRKHIEAFNCPREKNDCIAVVVDPSRPELADLLQHSATGVDASRLANFSVRFPYGADRPEVAKRHLAVLVGIPANYISSLVIGGKLASDQEKLAKLKALVASSGLDIMVLNFRGEKI